MAQAIDDFVREDVEGLSSRRNPIPYCTVPYRTVPTGWELKGGSTSVTCGSSTRTVRYLLSDLT